MRWRAGEIIRSRCEEPGSELCEQRVAAARRHYVEAGVPVTISTDNRLFSRTSVSEELWRIHTRCGIGVDALKKIVLNGFRFAFLPLNERLALEASARDALWT